MAMELPLLLQDVVGMRQVIILTETTRKVNRQGIYFIKIEL